MDLNRILLLALLAVPAVSAVVVAFLGKRLASAIRWISFGVTVFNLVVALVVMLNFLTLSRAETQPENMVVTFRPEMVPGADPNDRHKTTWKLLDFGKLGAVQFFIGIDGINLWLIVLTAVLMFSSVLISWKAIQERTNEY